MRCTTNFYNDPDNRRFAYRCVLNYLVLLNQIMRTSSVHNQHAARLAGLYAILKTKLAWNLKSLAKDSERIRIELLAYRSQVFIAVNSLEQACLYLEEALKASIDLQSKRRLQEVWTIFQQMRERWPREKKVQELGDFFFQSVNHR